MKKKLTILTIISIVAVMMLALSGCSNSVPVQRVLPDNSPWLNAGNLTETSVYSVQKKDGDTELNGEYTIVVDRLESTTVNVGDTQLADYSGYIANSILTMDNGDKVISTVAFSSLFVVQNSYIKYEYKDEPSKVVSAKYDDKKVHITTISGDQQQSTSLKYKKYEKQPYIDNLMIYLVSRCLTASSPTFSPNVISTDLGSSLGVTINTSTKEDIAFGNSSDNKVNCNVFEISLNRTFPGKGQPLKCYVANAFIKDNVAIEGGNANDKDVVKSALVKIVESNVTYTLVSTTINKS